MFKTEIANVRDFSARAVHKHLHSDQETENQKVDFLCRYFNHAVNVTIEAADNIFDYYRNLNLGLELDYEHLLKLRYFFPVELRLHWTAFLQLAINRSYNLTKKEKHDLLLREVFPHSFLHESPIYNRYANPHILKRISRDFLSGLTEDEFAPFASYYRVGNPVRYKAILDSRAVTLEAPSLVDSAGSKEEIAAMRLPPAPLMLCATIETLKSSFPTTEGQIFKEEAPIPLSCAMVGAGVGGVAGFLFAGPIGAAVIGFAGFWIGAAIGFFASAVIEVVKKQLTKQKEKAMCPDTPPFKSPFSSPKKRSLDGSRESFAFLSNRASVNGPEPSMG